MRSIVIIPARGGSEGIHRKNLQPVNGRSLLARAVTVAMKASEVDRVFVSTDDPAISDEARRWGAGVVDRPVDLAGSTATSESAVLHALHELRQLGIDPSITVFLQCTSPFTEPTDVDAIVSSIADNGADSAFTATRFHGFVWRRKGEAVQGVNHNEKEPRQRRQDRPEELLETGAAYGFRTPGFLAAKRRFFGRVTAVEVDACRALEIDDPQDLFLANLLAVGLDKVSSPRDISKAPRMVALDFDGVFTDNRVLVIEDGKEAVFCHRGDGHGLSKLKTHVPVIVLSTEKNPVVAARCQKLELQYIQGVGNKKLQALDQSAARMGVALEDVLFVGNDINDIECVRAAGVAVAVADAVPEVQAASDFTLASRGGEGAIRELCDLLLPLYKSTEKGQ